VTVLKSEFDRWMMHHKVKPASDVPRIVEEVMASLKSSRKPKVRGDNRKI
jgi:hypothetical protein